MAKVVHYGDDARKDVFQACQTIVADLVTCAVISFMLRCQPELHQSPIRFKDHKLNFYSCSLLRLADQKVWLNANQFRRTV